MKKLLIALSALTYVLLLGGCNTIAGAGEDIKRGGEKIEDAAKKK